MGNALDADGKRHELRGVGAEIVDLIQRAGFDTLRIPVQWSAHAARLPPFTIDPSFFELVDAALAMAVDVADMTSRAAWTTTVRQELERLRIGWCYWDFDTDFGAYDAEHRSWRDPLRAALFMG